MSKALGYAGSAALALAGLWFMTQPGEGPHWEKVALPSGEVLDQEAKLFAIRDSLLASPSQMTAGDWLALEAPLTEYMDGVELYLMSVSVHIYTDAVTLTRGANGHHLTDAQAEARALEMLQRTEEEGSPSWLSKVGLWVAEAMAATPDDLVRQELVRQMKPAYAEYRSARSRVDAIFEGLRKLPANTEAPVVDIELQIPFAEPVTIDKLNPLEIFFAEEGRSDSYGLWWDFRIAADMAAQVEATAANLPKALREATVTAIASWSATVLAESVGILLQSVGVSEEQVESIKLFLTEKPNTVLGALLVAAGGVVAFQTARTP